MADSCSFADNAAELNDRSEQFDTIASQILQQVMECAYFIRDYCQDTSFGKRICRLWPYHPDAELISLHLAIRLMKNMISMVDTRIEEYKTNLATLQQALLSRATVQCTVASYRVLDIVHATR